MFILARVTQSTSSGISTAGNRNKNVAHPGGNSNNNGSNSASRLDSSAETSSDECGSGGEEVHNVINAPSIEFEMMLPSVILSLNECYVQFLVELADFGCKIGNASVRECTRGVLDLLPIAKHVAERIKQYCKECMQGDKKVRKVLKLNPYRITGNTIVNSQFFFLDFFVRNGLKNVRNKLKNKFKCAGKYFQP